jgi:integrase
MTLENGRRKYFYAKTRQEVARRLAQALRDRDSGLPVVGEKLTVAQYLAQWLDDIAPSLKPRSLQRCEEDVRLRLVPALGKTSLARLSAQQVQSLYSAELKQGLAPGTVAHLHAVLRRALGEAQRLGIVQGNVATLVKAPRPARHEIHTLGPARWAGSWRSRRRTGWRRSTCWPSPPACGAGSCWACTGRT